MDPVIWAIVGSLVAALGFVYLVFIGQRSLAEWWRERQGRVRKSLPKSQNHTLASKQRIRHNLPARGSFVGRQKYIQGTLEAMSSCSLVSIEGLGGIGKTALALQVAYSCLDIGSTSQRKKETGCLRFYAIVWTTVRHKQLQLDSLLDTIARVLDYPSVLQQPMPEKEFQVSELLRKHNCLIIINNFEMVTDRGIVEFLRNLPESSKALITTRHQTFRDARPISVHGLEYDETLLLISEEMKRLGLQSLEFSDEAYREIYERTGGIPLAIKWSLGQIKQRGQSLDSVLDSLYHAQGDLFAFIFDRAWGLLTDFSKHILVTLPMFPARASKESVAAVADIPEPALTEGLGQLVEMWLIEPRFDTSGDARVWYSIHPLVRAYASHRQIELGEFIAAAKVRFIGYYRDFAKVHGGNEVGDRSRYDRLADELENIQGVLQQCLAENRWEEAKEIADSIMTFLSVDGYWEIRADLCRRLLDIAKERKDQPAEALFLGRLAFILAYRGDCAAAWNAAEQALEASQDLGVCEARSLAWDTMSLVLQWSSQPDMDKAWSVREQALAAHQTSKDRYWVTIDHLVLGKTAIGAMKYAVAEEHLGNALQNARQIDYRKAQGQILSELGRLYVLTDRTEAAGEYLSEALTIALEWRDLRVQALTKWYQSQLEVKKGQRRVSVGLAKEALDIALRLGMKREIPMMNNYLETLEEKSRHWLKRRRL